MLADLIALDPAAAAYVRGLHEQGLTGALRARIGDDDTAVAFDALDRAVQELTPATSAKDLAAAA